MVMRRRKSAGKSTRKHTDRVQRQLSSSSRDRAARRHARHEGHQELPEDIMMDAAQLFRENINAPFWKRRPFYFLVGLTVGLMGMFAVSSTPAAQSHLGDLQTYLALQLADIDLANVLPASGMIDDLFGNFTNLVKSAPSSEIPFMPAIAHREQLNLKPHFPVVLMHGIISSGLESWSTSEKSKKYFRKRMWGTTTMFRSVLLEKELWTEHLKLDPWTGLDPPDIKLRVAQGLDSADYFVTGYWIWAKIIENLAAIGYDSNTMHLASYDWRLSFANLETRDQYFSRLKSTIEVAYQANHRKSVVITHSMGSVLFPYFLKWVEHPDYGNGGRDWTDKYIESFVNVGGPMMGVPKALTSMLSGETRDTMNLGSFGAYLLEKFFSRRERANLMRTWAGGSSMLPKGGEIVWGTQQQAPDDERNEAYHSFGNMISFVPQLVEISKNGTEIKKTALHDILLRNHTIHSSMGLLHHSTDEAYQEMLKRNYSFGITTSKKQLAINDNDPRTWSNPVESKLPIAPNMKIYCFYGVGLPTERSYFYAATSDQDTAAQQDAMAVNDTDKHVAEAESKPLELYIDASIHDPMERVETGVRFSEGDGTVPLLSLGYMCAPSGGWTKHADLYNPGHSPVILKEYQDESEGMLNVRGGSKASNHVDILGNWEMTLDLLRIVSNQGDQVSQRITSNIEQIAQKVELQHER
ncbi:Lecithin:cholesterol acyltransferase-domain-containing protein [Radiomyces spectabilis]|uniref:Lecithin:cholesterol acyltransferase-domain-containing protein n=1 Tax=Radiomyces spectabilis TaxID=64574 RepID=UPI002220B750|nr:Lecithin:cholesterol acyltransferase-domain-containing protein [Radiomyces spectabilis]KAI8377935.1 Lecithin:cholesterol acyltransferase-domain-containing protein [Radiomyces spectabilis]